MTREQIAEILKEITFEIFNHIFWFKVVNRSYLW